MKTAKEIKRLISDNLHPDTATTKHGGNLLFRWEFFYRHGQTPKGYVMKINTLLESHGITDVKIIDDGEVWKPFNGGASTARSSHFYVEIECGIKDANADEEPQSPVDARGLPTWA